MRIDQRFVNVQYGRLKQIITQCTSQNNKTDDQCNNSHIFQFWSLVFNSLETSSKNY